jgi:hypothetical protein
MVLFRPGRNWLILATLLRVVEAPLPWWTLVVVNSKGGDEHPERRMASVAW